LGSSATKFLGEFPALKPNATAMSEPVLRALRTPEHWRKRADEVRALAAQMNDPDAKAAMLGVAKHYDELEALAATVNGADKKP